MNERFAAWLGCFLGGALLLGCSVKSPPNAVLVCTDSTQCPDGLVCTPVSGVKMLCCRNGNCGLGVDGSTSSRDGSTSGRDGSASNADGSTSSGDGSASSGDGGASSGGIVILDDGFDELDLETTCAGTICVTGGLTP